MNELTLVIPVYNSEKHLPELFHHLLKLKGISVIFVNDGSSDSSQALIEKFSLEIVDKVTSVVQENRGVSYARNVGLSHVKTRYVLFLDSDDHLFVENLVSALAKTRELSLNTYLFEYKKAVSKIATPDLKKIEIVSDPTVEYISGSLIDKVSLCSCIFETDFLRREEIIFEEDIKYGEDQLFLSQAIVKGKSIYFSGLQILLYFNNPESVMNTFSLSRMDALRSLLLISNLVRHDKFLLKKIEARYNRELVGIMTIYSKTHSLTEAFFFYSKTISPLVKSDKNHATIKDYIAIEYPYIYISLYKLYRVIINAIK